MKNTTAIILLAVVFVLGFFILYRDSSKKQKIFIVEEAKEQTAIKQNWESKIDEQASVTVTVTPIDISSDSKEWKFNVLMDTHSVELDQDMLRIAVLVDDKDKEYKPLRWEGAEPGGHHREGVLIFNQIVPSPKSIKLKISSIGEAERNFIWQL
ncbi:MAG: hypothetical protein UU13_C0006G0018 [Candidatus Nomurabacteria bacterium GW2011_GWB1_40_7]|uniref:DUF4352 domain-containing protein n=1 Tax=Candidatus Nomurabacteria bacterium GW2011_GWB1_40_7 TaxID=1618744 RepID=A0A0G0T6Q7_9BACT|nr:MAG: hypothetical protein UU13_C0006G0018 [Candidatus Nomurabacteria bacterium GW2011_GWB1_40_7]